MSKCDTCLDAFLLCMGKDIAHGKKKKKSHRKLSERQIFISECMKKLKSARGYGTGFDGAQQRLKECSKRYKKRKANKIYLPDRRQSPTPKKKKGS